MDLTSPLSSLIPSLDAVALEVLSGTQSALGISQIHRLGRRGSRQGVANALERLVEHGLVIMHPTNHGAVYQLNRGHLLAPAVLLAADARGTLLQRLASRFEKLSPRPVSVSLFGSVARKESTPTSDIDVLVIVDDDHTDRHSDRWLDQLRELSMQVDVWTGNHLEVLTYAHAELTALVHANEPIIASWREEATTIVGTDIRTLIDHAHELLPSETS